MKAFVGVLQSRTEPALSMADAKDAAVPAEAQPLGRWPVLSYGVGHMLNDITSACWFTYLLLFLQQIGLAPRYPLHNLCRLPITQPRTCASGLTNDFAGMPLL